MVYKRRVRSLAWLSKRVPCVPGKGRLQATCQHTTTLLRLGQFQNFWKASDEQGNGRLDKAGNCHGEELDSRDILPRFKSQLCRLLAM